MQVKEKFSKAELRGRELTEALLFDTGYSRGEFTFTDYPFDRADMYLNTKSGVSLVEIKLRDEKYSTYQRHILELSKLKGLQDKYDNDNLTGRIWYFNFFGDSLMYAYDITDDTELYVTEGILMNNTTVINNGKSKKDVIYLDSRLAIKFKKENNKWQRI